MVYVQTDGSVQEQVANMEAALARGPDALITSTVDNAAFDDVIKRARDAGVIVIASHRTSMICKGLQATRAKPLSGRVLWRLVNPWAARNRRTFLPMTRSGCWPELI